VRPASRSSEHVLCFAGHSRSGDPLSHAGIATPQPVPPPPHQRRLPVRQRIHRSIRTDPLSGPSSSPTFLSLGIRFFLFPIFFGLTARVIPLRSGLRVFCFHGFSPDSMVPHKADASLRLHAPSLSLVPQENGAERKVKENVLSTQPLSADSLNRPRSTSVSASVHCHHQRSSRRTVDSDCGNERVLSYRRLVRAEAESFSARPLPV
jgi:hypothetical protein